MVYDASSAQALNSFGDKYYFLKDQIKWVILGLLAMLAAAFIDYRWWYRMSPVILGGALLLLLLVFVPGLGVRAYGARRWIDLRFFVLQPSELAKPALIIYLSAWFTNREKGRLVSFLLLLGMVIGLIMLEPDMGTAIILSGTGVIIYFLSGAPIAQFLSLIPLGIAGGLVFALKSSYRLKRITTFLDLNSDPLGASYHIRQVLIALGSGGLFGLGLGNSRQKYSYLPEAMTDSIFAIVGEELGFLGAIVLFLVFIFLLFESVRISLLAKDNFGKLLGMGIASWLTLQTIINFGSMVALMPLTGVPLPFLSYGGSALIVELMGVGILLNISRSKNS